MLNVAKQCQSDPKLLSINILFQDQTFLGSTKLLWKAYRSTQSSSPSFCVPNHTHQQNHTLRHVPLKLTMLLQDIRAISNALGDDRDLRSRGTMSEQLPTIPSMASLQRYTVTRSNLGRPSAFLSSAKVAANCSIASQSVPACPEDLPILR